MLIGLGCLFFRQFRLSLINLLIKGVFLFRNFINSAISLITSLPAWRNIQCSLIKTEFPLVLIESMLVELSVRVKESVLSVSCLKYSSRAFLLYENRRFNCFIISP